MLKCKFSFIVAVYNVEKYLPLCIESVQKQTFKNIEIILVEDGSSDKSGMICDEYALNDNRIKVIHQNNQGVSVARNAGIEVAEGEWICFVDGDDWIEEDYCEKILEKVKEEYDIIFFSYNSVYVSKTIDAGFYAEDGQIFDTEDFHMFTKRILNPDKKSGVLAPLSPCMKVYKKQFLQKSALRFVPGIIKGQDAVFNMDAYYFAKKGCYVASALYNYRKNSASISNRFSKQIVHYSVGLIQGIKDELIKTKRFKQFHEEYIIKIFWTYKSCLFLNVFHEENPGSYSDRKKFFKNINNEECFLEMFRELNVNGLAIEVKCLFFLAKWNMFFLLQLLFKGNIVLKRILQKEKM